MDSDELSPEEQRLYDRQLRVWGAEAQARLKRADVLVLGAVGKWGARSTAGEVMKNLCLSGVGAITVAACDGGLRAPASGGDAAEGISLLSGMHRWSCTSGTTEAVDGASEAEAEAQRVVVALRDMNPLVNVQVARLNADTKSGHVSDDAPCTAPSVLDDGVLSKHQCVLIFRQQFSFDFVRGVARAARAARVGCYVVEVRGEHGYFASDLGKHKFKEDQGDMKGNEYVQDYPPLEDVFAMPRSSLPKRAPQMAAALRGASGCIPELFPLHSLTGAARTTCIICYCGRDGCAPIS